MFSHIFVSHRFDPAEGRTFLRTLGAQRASVRPYIKKEQFSDGSRLRNTKKLNVFVCLGHGYTSILTLKMYFDYKSVLVYYALDPRFYCRRKILVNIHRILMDFFHCRFS